MKKENTCCFTGPRSPRLPQSREEISELKEKLLASIVDAYYGGYRYFISGMAEGFDLFAAEAVFSLKSSFSDIKLVAALPYKSAPQRQSEAVSEIMYSILENADIVESVFEEYIPGCEHSRNRYMVDRSSMIIGYYNGLSSGTAHCWSYALENELKTVNLYESKL